MRLPAARALARRAARWTTCGLVALLASCVVVPRTTATYDPDCRVERREMILEMHEVGGFAGCSNEGCVTLLVAAGAVTVATAVVSGSIAMAGNIVYWLERQGQCNRP